MKLVFIDQLGCYAALLAASYQTGKIGGQPSRQEILGLPAFADHQTIRFGDLRELGRDSVGNLVYTLGVGGEAKIMMISALELLRICGAGEDIRVINVSTFNDTRIKFCWYLGLIPYLKGISRKLSAVFLEKKCAQLFEQLDAKLTATGLEYSDLDLESQDQG